MVVYKFTCSLPKWHIFLQVQDYDLLHYIKNAFINFVCTETSYITDLNNCIYINNETTGCSIKYKTEEFRTSHNYDEILFVIYEFFEKSAMQYQYNNICSFHGGVITKNGKAFALLAKSHIGKSTLIANMVTKQIKCLSDDTVYVDNTTYCVYEFPLPIRIRDFTYVNIDKSIYNIVNLKNCYTKEKEYFIVSPHMQGQCNARLNYFVFLERNNDTEVTPVSKLQCCKNLLYNYKTLQFENKKLDIAKLAETIPAINLKYNNPNNAVCLLKELFEQNIV